MILLGERYSAQDVPMLGFDWQVVAADDMAAQAQALASTLPPCRKDRCATSSRRFANRPAPTLRRNGN